ncbi:Uncharacterized protein Fot_05166 [Forsythia ovata]|uniref:Ribonuclease II-like double HTH domain-containing protein n=1 Tax=Forsythia ovata TaxID=205694 RepID=A0ABD1WPC8_9LAMI
MILICFVGLSTSCDSLNINCLVDELLRRKHAKEAAEKKLKEFVKLLKSARKMPLHSKPAKSSWRTEEKIRHRIEPQEAYAIDKHYILPIKKPPYHLLSSTTPFSCLQ